MNKILAIETASTYCSIGFYNGAECSYFITDTEPLNHAQKCTSLIEKTLSENQLAIHDLDAIAVSIGPGSYTGLRIGLSVAKGMAYGADLPILGIDTLEIMANKAMAEMKSKLPDYIVSIIDARRNDIYYSIFKKNGDQLLPSSAYTLEHNFLNTIPKTAKIVLIGDGAQKSLTFLEEFSNVTAEEILPEAQFMGRIIQKALKKNEYLDLAYSEPNYIKEVYITSGKS